MEPLILSKTVIYALLVAIIFLPLRVAFFALLLLVFFDASGSRFTSAIEVGIANMLKVLIAPLILIIRLRFEPLRIAMRLRNGKRAIQVFLLLIIYASLATLWSDWHLSGFKMVGFLLGHIMWFFVIAQGWREGQLNRRTLMWVLIAGILFGVIQSYVMDPSYGVYRDGTQRFTAFLSPQYYAGIMVFIATLLVCDRSVAFVKGMSILLVTFWIVVLTGSRYSFLGLLFVAGIFIANQLRKERNRVYALALLSGLTSAIGLSMIVSTFGYQLPLGKFLKQTRIGELGHLIDDPEEIGTLFWRLQIYEEVITQISTSKAVQVIFGHGTSSGAEVALVVYPWQYSPKSIDANRVIHNEFLRALYEWGVIGLMLLIYMVLAIVGLAIHTVTSSSTKSYALFATLPMLIMSLMIENVLASAGSGWGVGISLVLATAWTHFRASSESTNALARAKGREASTMGAIW